MTLRKYLFPALAGCAALAVNLTPARADQIEQLFKPDSAGCIDSVKVNLVDAIRSGIDKEVQRHEAVLQKPPALDQLGCLDNLLNLNLDFAIQVPDLTQMFKSAISNAEQQLCSYAEDAWSKVTEPLQSAMQLPSFNSLQLPGGMGGGNVPTLDYDYSGGSLNMQQPQGSSSGRRVNDGSLMHELYNNLYGPGQM